MDVADCRPRIATEKLPLLLRLRRARVIGERRERAVRRPRGRGRRRLDLELVRRRRERDRRGLVARVPASAALVTNAVVPAAPVRVEHGEAPALLGDGRVRIALRPVRTAHATPFGRVEGVPAKVDGAYAVLKELRQGRDLRPESCALQSAEENIARTVVAAVGIRTDAPHAGERFALVCGKVGLACARGSDGSP